jgi:hypothetical protein
MRDVERFLDTPARLAYMETLQGIVASVLSGEGEDKGDGQAARDGAVSGGIGWHASSCMADVSVLWLVAQEKEDVALVRYRNDIAENIL